MRVTVCGAGTCGLVAAMMLAKDGHEVTVVERDPMEPPAPSDAWEAWERRGVNQFRLPHFLMPRFRYDLVRELPEVVDALTKAGALELNFFGPFRDVVPEPERFDVITARRPIVEAVVAEVAARTDGVDIRRGVAIAGVLTGPPTRAGVPHVTGLVTTEGEEIRADVVVCAAGRRSPLGRWIVDAGGRPPFESVEDSGFVYYGFYGRSPSGEQLVPGPSTGDFGSIGLLSLPADDGTVGMGIIAATGDNALRKLKDMDVWRSVMQRIPGGDVLCSLEPMSDVNVMAGIEDRYRRFVVDGEPVATGVLAIADAWAATNPTLGRGIALGVMHAMHLRDLLHGPTDDPYETALAWDHVTETNMTPWYDSTVWHDRRKVRTYAAEAGIGEPVREQEWDRYVALGRAFSADLDLAVLWAERAGFLMEPPSTLLQNAELCAKLDAMVPGNGLHEGPSRQELLELVGAS